MNKFSGVLDEENSDVNVGDFLFILNDGRVIYEMSGIKTFLFKNKQDFKTYINKSVELALSSTKSKISVRDDKFISKRDLYIELFRSAYFLKLDTKDITTLSNVDSTLNKLSEQDILKYKLTIIAIIGEYIVQNSKDAVWQYLNHPSDGKIPIITASGTIIEPIKIFEVQFYEQYKKGKQFNLYETIHQYKNYYSK